MKAVLALALMALPALAMAGPKHTRQMLAATSPFCAEIAATSAPIAELARKHGFTSWANLYEDANYQKIPKGIIWENAWGLASNAVSKLIRTGGGACEAELWSREMRKDSKRWTQVADAFRASGMTVMIQESSADRLTATAKMGNARFQLSGSPIREGISIRLKRQ